MGCDRNNRGNLNGGTEHGFVYQNGVFTTVTDPNAGTRTATGGFGTSITGINDSGEIVGNYSDSGGTTHSFTATYLQLDYFVAQESKTGDYYLGYVVDDQDKYATGSGFTSATTDQAGGHWTYYVYGTSGTTSLPPADNGYVYDTGYWDADLATGYAPIYSISGTNFLGTDADYITINGNVYEYGGGSYVVPDVKIDYFIASESKTGDYYLGYVIDDQGKYSTGSGFTSTTTDSASGQWTYYVYNTAATTPDMTSQNGYVYDTGYWDANLKTGYTPVYAVSGTSFLGNDVDYINIGGTDYKYGGGSYVVPAVKIDYFHRQRVEDRRLLSRLARSSTIRASTRPAAALPRPRPTRPAATGLITSTRRVRPHRT